MKIKDLETTYKQGAGCLLLARTTDQFLLIKRSQYVAAPGVWSLPGGKVELDEHPEHAAKREVLEEIGIDLSKIPAFLIYTNETHAPRFKFYTFACILEDEMEPILNWESEDFLWCNMSSLPSPLHWGVDQLLASHLAGKRLKKVLDQQKAVD